MKYIQRKLQDYILKQVQKQSAVILVGPRQVGKTMLCEWVKSKLPETGIKCLSFSMEISKYLSVFSKGFSELMDFLALNGYRKEERTVIVIDEFQYIPEVNSLLKSFADTVPDTTILATGSSSIDIKKFLKESLAGRKRVVEIFPLDYSEYLTFTHSGGESNFRDLDFDNAAGDEIVNHLFTRFDEFAVWGGMPKVTIQSEVVEKQKELEEIYNAYIQKDIRALLDDHAVVHYNDLIEILCSQIGNLAHFDELSKLLRIKRYQVEKYLYILEKTYVNYLVDPFFENKRKEISKSKKTYFYDAGVRNQILRNFAVLDRRSDKGRLVENAVFTELKKNLMVNQDILFWRTQNGTEVDFIIKQNEKHFPIEVKSSWRGSFVPPNISSFIEKHKSVVAFILNNGSWKKVKQGNCNVYFLPYFAAGKIPEWLFNAPF